MQSQVQLHGTCCVPEAEEVPSPARQAEVQVPTSLPSTRPQDLPYLVAEVGAVAEGAPPPGTNFMHLPAIQWIPARIYNKDNYNYLH